MEIVGMSRYEEGIVTGSDLRNIVQGFMRSSQTLMHNPRLPYGDKRYLEGKLDMATTLLGFVLRLDKTEIQGENEMQLTTLKKPLTLEEAGLGTANGEISQALLELSEKLTKEGDNFPLDAPGIKLTSISSTLYHLRKAQKISKEFGIRKAKEGKYKGKPCLVRGQFRTRSVKGSTNGTAEK